MGNDILRTQRCNQIQIGKNGFYILMFKEGLQNIRITIKLSYTKYKIKEEVEIICREIEIDMSKYVCKDLLLYPLSSSL